MARVPHRLRGQKCGIFEVKRRLALEKAQLLLKVENPTLNQAQSEDGSPQWVAQMRPWLRPFRAGLYAFFENKKVLREMAGNSRLRAKNLGTILKIAAFSHTEIVPGK